MKELPEELQANIAAYLDGELPPAESARLEVFLANTDPELAGRILSMVLDKSAVRSLPKVETPSDLSTRVMEAVERASLMHGVENLAQSQHRWWQSRSAIAAAVLIMVGGFSWFVIQAVYHPDNQIRQIVRNGGDEMKSSASGGTGGLGGTSGAPDLKVAMLGKGVNGGEADTEKVLEEQVAKSQTTVNITFEEAKRNGFQAADTPQVALENVKALPQKFTSGSPVVLTLVERNTSDREQLWNMLQAYVAQDKETAAQQKLVYEREGNNTLAAADIVQNTGTINGAAGAGTLNTGNTTAVNGGMSAQQAVRPDQQYNSNGGLNGGQAKQVASNTLGNNSYTQFNYKNGGFEQIDNNSNNDRARYAVAPGSRDNGQQQAVARATNSNNDGAAAPFRVVLRPAQLAEIANTFEVHAVTRGSNAYVINNNARPSQVDGDARREMYASKDGLHAPSAPMPTVAPATTPAVAVAPGASAGGNFGPVDVDVVRGKGGTPTIGKGAAASASAGAGAGSKFDNAVHDAVRGPSNLNDNERFAQVQAGNLDLKQAKSESNFNTQRAMSQQAFDPSKNKSAEQWVECIISIESATPETIQMNAEQMLNRSRQSEQNAVQQQR